jgi:mRNA interferase MazF
VVVRQGDVFWLDLGEPSGSAPGFRHPHLVVQSDVFNDSPLQTTVVCVITSSLQRAKAPGNVLLDQGEGGLPQPSVVNVSQIFTVDKEDLIEKIGTLSPERLREVLDGVYLLLEPEGIPS